MEVEDDTKENEGMVGAGMEGEELVASIEALENVTKILACAKCGRIPSAKDKVYTLGNCFHKYCSSCVADFSGNAQSCVALACKMITKPGKAVEDTFSSSVVVGLLKLKAEMKRTPRFGVPLRKMMMASTENDDDSTTAIDFIPTPIPSKRSRARANDDIQPTKLTKTGKRGGTESPDITDPPSTKRRSKLQKSVSAKRGKRSSNTNEVTVVASTPTKATKGRSNSKIKSAESTPSLGERGRKASSSENSSFTSPSAKIDKKNAKGETQLHIACRKGELDKVEQLLLAGANPNIQDYGGWTPLHETINGKANSSSKLDLVKLLIERGSCNPNIPGMDNETVLHDAARENFPDIIIYLLEHGASPNIRNRACKLPREIAATEEIAKILEDASTKFSNESLVDDPAVLEIQLSTAVVHLKLDVSSDLYSKIEQILKLKVSKDLRTEVTHLVFPCDGSGKEEKVALSLDYLFGIATGAWMVNSEWITNSLAANKVLSPFAFEIFGCQLSTEATDSPVRLARLNKEVGNPGLLHGFCFYFYKNTSFMNMEKNELVPVVNLAGGVVISQPPNPTDVENSIGLEYPIRFHAKQDNHKLVLTSHIILYDDENKPPPSKLYDMEHIKALKIQWLIDSLRDFKIQDIDSYL